MTLTPRQLAVASALRRFWFWHNYAPTFQELADILHIGKVSAWEHIVELERKGVLRRTRRPRSLELVPGVRLPDESRATKFPVLGEIE